MLIVTGALSAGGRCMRLTYLMLTLLVYWGPANGCESNDGALEGHIRSMAHTDIPWEVDI